MSDQQNNHPRPFWLRLIIVISEVMNESPAGRMVFGIPMLILFIAAIAMVMKYPGEIFLGIIGLIVSFLILLWSWRWRENIIIRLAYGAAALALVVYLGVNAYIDRSEAQADADRQVGHQIAYVAARKLGIPPKINLGVQERPVVWSRSLPEHAKLTEAFVAELTPHVAAMRTGNEPKDTVYAWCSDLIAFELAPRQQEFMEKYKLGALSIDGSNVDTVLLAEIGKLKNGPLIRECVHYIGYDPQHRI